MEYHKAPVPDRQYLGRMAKRLDEPGVLGRVILWIKLSCGRVPGFRFVHDHKVAGHVIDFYCPEVRLGIDVNTTEEKRNEADEARQVALEAHGIMLVRFTEEEIQDHTEDVLEHIRILATAFERMSRAG